MVSKQKTPAFDSSRDISLMQKDISALKQNTTPPKLYQYDPTWSTDGTQPSIGDGTLIGSFMRWGKWVYANIHLTWGSATTPGTSFWKFSLPVPPDSNGGFFVGSCACKDATAQWYVGACQYWDAATSTIVAFCGQNVTGIGAGNPFTWAVNDFVVITLTYPTTT